MVNKNKLANFLKYNTEFDDIKSRANGSHIALFGCLDNLHLRTVSISCSFVVYYIATDLMKQGTLTSIHNFLSFDFITKLIISQEKPL